MKKPDFFIVGAPKCGTTALCKYLDEHPDLYIPPLKELNYFGADLTGNKKAHTLDEYLAYFSDAKDQLCGEGTPWYLFSQKAASEIHDFNPNAKIIVMLREPVSLLYSLHSQHLYNGSSEDIQDFKAALEAEADRHQGLRLPPRCIRPEGLLYREVVKFTPQLERYFQIFGRDRVRVIIFDDFIKDTAAVYRDTLAFLGVDPNFETPFFKINSNKQVRNRGLQQLVKHPPAKLLEIGKFLIPLPQSTRRALLEGIKAQLNRVNTKQAPRSPLDPELKKALQQEFAPEIERLSQLLGRDLTHWSRS